MSEQPVAGTALPDIGPHELLDLIPHRYPMLLVDRIEEIKAARNAGWSQPMGKEILAGGKSLADMETHALANGEPKKISGRQELLENLLNEFI